INMKNKNVVKISYNNNKLFKISKKEEKMKVLLKILPEEDILLAGDKKMDIIIGEKDPTAIIEKSKEMGISYIAIKQGSLGSVGYFNGKTNVADPVHASKVAATVGVGDGFNADVFFGYLHGWTLKTSLDFANIIGTIVVGIIGDNEGLSYYEDFQEKLGEIERVER